MLVQFSVSCRLDDDESRWRKNRQKLTFLRKKLTVVIKVMKEKRSASSLPLGLFVSYENVFSSVFDWTSHSAPTVLVK